MGRAPTGGAAAFRFTAKEVAEMEKALESSKGSTPPRSVVTGLAESFSLSPERSGQKPVQWKQVWNWFQNRRHSQKAKVAKSPEKLKAVSAIPDSSQPKKVPAPSAAVQSGAVRSRNEAHQMEFEAKSARDGAWYDVSTFILHRLASSGDPEVRVRFAGFGSEEDEWVNVRSAVRQRSLPCEASECVAVLPGDLILCFQEGNEQALYFDADILDVQRRRHDVRGCRCRFWVRYRHDQSEEVVPLRKVCRRPETEYRLLKLQSYGKNPGTPLDGSPAIQRLDPPSSVPVGEEVAPAGTSSVVVRSSEIVEPVSTGRVRVDEPSLVTSSMMEVDSASVVSPKIISSVGVSDLKQVPTNMQLMSETVQAGAGQEGGRPVGPPERVEMGKQLSGNTTPTLQAQPEMFDSEIESIVVLDRSDLESMRKS